PSSLTPPRRFRSLRPCLDFAATRGAAQPLGQIAEAQQSSLPLGVGLGFGPFAEISSYEEVLPRRRLDQDARGEEPKLRVHNRPCHGLLAAAHLVKPIEVAVFGLRVKLPMEVLIYVPVIGAGFQPARDRSP